MQNLFYQISHDVSTAAGDGDSVLDNRIFVGSCEISNALYMFIVLRHQGPLLLTRFNLNN